MPHSLRLRLVACASALAVGLGLLGAGLPATAAASHDTTSAKEKKRVDSVKTPKIGWYDCYGGYNCATVKLPRDYDHPKGAKTEIALLRYPAADQQHKIGTLFVNPGGPGGSGTALAFYAPGIFGPDILDRFDVVGFDPRGTNFSDNVKCFASPAKQASVMARYTAVVFPVTAAEQKVQVKAGKQLGHACATSGKPLSVSMSTAEVARDLDVLRRAVGDKKLTYLGFSYGTYLGQVYANLFPDRVRALALDGVVDPTAWRGSHATRNASMWDRIRSAEGGLKALNEIFARCQQAGADRCDFGGGDPAAAFDRLAEQLKTSPVLLDDGQGGIVEYTYADLIGDVLSILYLPFAGDELISYLDFLESLMNPPTTITSTDHAAVKSHQAAEKGFAKLRRAIQKRSEGMRRPGLGFPYDNSFDALLSVSCTDSAKPASIARFPSYAAAAEARAGYFGPLWVWNSAPCAKDAFKASDEDAYRGSFTHKTVNPILFVGDYYDPATNYNSAVKAASLAPNSRLLSSDSWGHTAYGTSACATDAVDRYLLHGTLPAAGTVCVGDDQPFTGDPGEPEVQVSGKRVTVQDVVGYRF